MQPSSELLEAPQPKPLKKSHQFKALFLKSATLQSKQIGTNVCQILTPIICLFFTYLIKQIATDNLNVSQDQITFGIPLNFPVWGTPAEKLIDITCLQWYAFSSSDSSSAYVGTKDGLRAGSGLLGKVKTLNDSGCQFNNSGYQDVTVVDSKISTPFFRKTNDSSKSVNYDVANRTEYVNKQDYKHTLDVIPDGTVHFYEASDTRLNATIQINDGRTFQYHRMNGVTGIKMKQNLSQEKFQGFITVPEGQLSFVDLLNNAYLQQLSNGNAQLATGIVYMPPAGDSNILVNSIINLVGSTIFPLALSLLFPVFLYAIVLEKEERLIQMMKMNGMSMKNYWLVTFLFNLFLSLITNIIFYLFGYLVVKNTFFTETPFGMMFVILFGWMLAQIGMATLFQTILSNSRSANIIGYLLSIWTSLMGASLNVGVYQFPTELPYGLRMYAPLGFTRIFYIMLTKCSNNLCLTSWKQAPDEMIDCVVYLYACFAVFMVLGMYLHEIIPQEYGVARPWTYPVKFLKDMCRKKIDDSEKIEQDKQLDKYVKEEDEDEDARHERVEVGRFTDHFAKYPLICNNLRKLYKKEGRKDLYAAVKSFNLIIEPNQIFGLLGPNGAGKTTLISLITGMFEPDNGNAWVSGYSIRDEIEKVHLEMGVCPQFDLLWPEMTVEQHLFFYARLKGASRKQQKQKVEEAIREVNLQKFTKFKTTQLSGGMKRRLSVAISLVGTPSIVFLDQPTTGLDPENRRQLWTVLAKAKERRAMFLTTHMMDEADTLCNRIGIITNGILRTVANQIKLRKRYGGGYRLDINLSREDFKLRESMVMNEENDLNDTFELNEEQLRKQEELEMQEEQKRDGQIRTKSEKLMKFIRDNFEHSKMLKVFNGNFIYQLGGNVLVSEVFETLEKHKAELQIAHWGVINSSLEDVFLTVVQKFDKEEILDHDEEHHNMAEPMKDPELESSVAISESSRGARESVMSNPARRE